MTSWVRGKHSGAAIAWVIAVGIPLLVTVAVPHGIKRTNVPSGFMLLGVLGATALGGLWCGIAAASLAVIVLDVVFLGRAGSISFGSGTDQLAAVVYAAVAFSLVLMFDLTLRRARRNEASTAQLRTRLDAEQETLASVQRALLPRDQAFRVDVRLGMQYRGADAPDRLGGDWYAIIPFDDRRIGLAIGDVAGSGLDAVAAMAEVRFALRALAFEVRDPDAVLELLNRHVQRFQPGTMITALYGILDPAESTWRYASAGHLPALVKTKDHAHYLERGSGPPLGVVEQPDYQSSQAMLAPRSTIVLYTDGLIERRNESLDTGLERLRSTVEQSDPDPSRLCEGLVAALVPAGRSDDVAILAASLDR